MSDYGGYREQTVKYHGSCEIIREAVAPGRRVVEGSYFHASPEECCLHHPNEWIEDGTILICTGCGIDGT